MQNNDLPKFHLDSLHKEQLDYLSELDSQPASADAYAEWLSAYLVRGGLIDTFVPSTFASEQLYWHTTEAAAIDPERMIKLHHEYCPMRLIVSTDSATAENTTRRLRDNFFGYVEVYALAEDGSVAKTNDQRTNEPSKEAREEEVEQIEAYIKRSKQYASLLAEIGDPDHPHYKREHTAVDLLKISLFLETASRLVKSSREPARIAAFFDINPHEPPNRTF